MSDFSSWEEVKEYLEHRDDPDDWTTVRLEQGRGVQLYWCNSFASCGDDQCCWDDFKSTDDAIDDIKLHCSGNLEWVIKDE